MFKINRNTFYEFEWVCWSFTFTIVICLPVNRHIHLKYFSGKKTWKLKTLQFFSLFILQKYTADYYQFIS